MDTRVIQGVTTTTMTSPMVARGVTAGPMERCRGMAAGVVMARVPERATTSPEQARVALAVKGRDRQVSAAGAVTVRTASGWWVARSHRQTAVMADQVGAALSKVGPAEMVEMEHPMPWATQSVTAAKAVTAVPRVLRFFHQQLAMPASGETEASAGMRSPVEPPERAEMADWAAGRSTPPEGMAAREEKVGRAAAVGASHSKVRGTGPLEAMVGGEAMADPERGLVTRAGMGARVVMPATAPRPETRAQAALGGVDRMERPPGRAVLRERPATT